MAQKVHIILVDDIDGSDAAETVSFALDGVNYEIDLNAENAAKLRESLAPFIAHGRKQGRTRAATPRRTSKAASETAKIREWARSKGMTVSDRGRVSAEIRAAYEAANN
jgi:hypothetical protein